MFFPNQTRWNQAAAWPAIARQPVFHQAGYQPVPAQVSPYFPLQNLPTAPVNNGLFAASPSYPATNMPHMWSRLHPYISGSPTLQQRLPQLASDGWTLNWAQNQGSSCDLVKRRITIDMAGPDGLLMQTLAHESSHAFDRGEIPQYHPSEVTYANAKLRNEAVATVQQLRVRSEIYQRTGQDIGISLKDPGYYDAAMNFSQRHGNEERLLQHVQRLLTWDITSVQGRSYWEVFLNEWRGTRGWAPALVTPDMVDAQRSQAHAALSAEMNAR